MLPLLDELTEKLTNLKLEDGQQNVLASLDAELLECCVENRPKFEKDMRNGLLHSFDLQLCRVALLVAKAVPGHSAEELASINPKFTVDIAIAALDACLEAPGVAEAKKSLQGWQKRERSSIQVLELMKVLQYYPETLAEEFPEDLRFAHHGKILFESILAVGTETLSKNEKARRACGVAYAVLFESLLQVCSSLLSLSVFVSDFRTCGILWCAFIDIVLIVPIVPLCRSYVVCPTSHVLTSWGVVGPRSQVLWSYVLRRTIVYRILLRCHVFCKVAGSSTGPVMQSWEDLKQHIINGGGCLRASCEQYVSVSGSRV